MASRIMHLAIASQLEKVLPISDSNRFRVGHILPDSVLSVDKWKINTHFVEIFDNGKRKHFDFYKFFARYKKEILTNELYLGYYFHLIQDGIFRDILYNDMGFISKRGDQNFLNELYNDYHILNGWAVEKYKLVDNLFEPKGYKSEKINEIFLFEINDFIKDMKADFNERIDKEPKYFKKIWAEIFIEKCVDICVSEYQAISGGSHAVDKYDYSWETRTANLKSKE